MKIDLGKILKSIGSFFSGAARKVKEALTFGKDIANRVKQVIDSPLLDVVVKLTPTPLDNNALAAVRTALAVWIEKIGWADKKVSDFDETTLPHVLNAISAEAAKLTAEYNNADLSRQQAIASAQVVYDPKIVA